LLEEEVGEGRFEVLLTTSPDFNRYSRWLHRRWGHVKSIRFCGFLPKAELEALYASTSCLVFPSQVETWGLPISEFAKTGRPMLLADRPYAHETAGGSASTAFFDPDEPQQLKQLMLQLLLGDHSNLQDIKPTMPQPPIAHSWNEVINHH
jgi:glycosyltransferase involved in cell wall biosynthesis